MLSAHATRVFALWCCALSVCVCVVPSPRGVQARLGPLAEAGGMPHPNTKGSTRLHHSLCCPSCTNSSGSESYQGSRGSTAQRSLSKPLSVASSWIRSCEDQKNSEATRQVRKLHAANV